MTPETQKLVDKRNEKELKAMEELQKLPYSQEQINKQVNDMFEVHNQINPNKMNFDQINPSKTDIHKPNEEISEIKKSIALCQTALNSFSREEKDLVSRIMNMQKKK